MRFDLVCMINDYNVDILECILKHKPFVILCCSSNHIMHVIHIISPQVCTYITGTYYMSNLKQLAPWEIVFTLWCSVAM